MNENHIYHAISANEAKTFNTEKLRNQILIKSLFLMIRYRFITPPMTDLLLVVLPLRQNP